MMEEASFTMLVWGFSGLLLKNQKLCPNKGETFFFFLNKQVSLKVNSVWDNRLLVGK